MAINKEKGSGLALVISDTTNLFCLYILKLNTQISNPNVDLIDFYNRCMLVEFYDFLSKPHQL
jgi:hypothetical protein